MNSEQDITLWPADFIAQYRQQAIGKTNISKTYCNRPFTPHQTITLKQPLSPNQNNTVIIDGTRCWSYAQLAQNA